jgi:hypothetical protein
VLGMFVDILFMLYVIYMEWTCMQCVCCCSVCWFGGGDCGTMPMLGLLDMCEVVNAQPAAQWC